MAAGAACPMAAEAGSFSVDEEAEKEQETGGPEASTHLMDTRFLYSWAPLPNIPHPKPSKLTPLLNTPPKNTQHFQVAVSVQMYKPGGKRGDMDGGGVWALSLQTMAVSHGYFV